MEELEKTAKALIWDIAERTIKSLKDNGLLAEPSKLQMLCSRPEMTSLIKKLSTPKHDPCRKFRKGDKAKPRIINGRETPRVPLDVIFTVTGDEDEYGAVPVEYMSPMRGLRTSTTVHAVWLELVTPVEELEPYVVRLAKPDGVEEWHVEPRNCTLSLVAVFGHLHPYAKEAAEAECARLNAEFRKEREND